jgi:uncharacterized protein YeaO (DUF488 family)
MKSKVLVKNVKLKRAYDEPAAADGVRMLVDRLWPRGMKKGRQRSICGPRTSCAAPSCGNGSATNPCDMRG